MQSLNIFWRIVYIVALSDRFLLRSWRRWGHTWCNASMKWVAFYGRRFFESPWSQCSFQTLFRGASWAIHADSMAPPCCVVWAHCWWSCWRWRHSPFLLTRTTCMGASCGNIFPFVWREVSCGQLAYRRCKHLHNAVNNWNFWMITMQSQFICQYLLLNLDVKLC